MTRAIISGSGHFFHQLFRHMNDRHDWEISCWIVDEGEVSVAASLFPRAHIVGMQNLNRGELDASIDPSSFPPVDEDLIRDLKWCESIVMEMMDRFDTFKILRYDDRLRLYHFYIRYWLVVIEKIRPEVFFASYAPHEICDFVLFALCKCLKIPTMMFEWTSLPGLRLLVEDYRDVSKEMGRENYVIESDGSPVVLSATTEAELSRLQLDYQRAMPGYFAASQNDRELKIRSSGINLFLPRLKRIAQKLLTIPKLMETEPQHLDGLYFRSALSPELVQRSPTRLERSLHSRNIVNSFLLAKKIYKSLCIEPNLSAPYVYLALHFQPERTTCPGGGMFSDQRLVVSLLASSLPAGWILYVKEHPSQFIESRYGYLSRSPSFYLDIAAHKNVRFIKQDVPQFDLIDNSMAVATITGTTGWEALVRGKPSLVFGEAWYQTCRGVYRIRTKEDCRKSILNIIDRPHVSKGEVRNFLARIERVAIRVHLGEEEAGWDSKVYDEQENIEVCAKSMINIFQNAKRTQMSA